TQTQGIFSSGDWFPNSGSFGNKQFIAAYLKKYGGNALGIDSTSAEAYAVGQLIQQVAQTTHSISNHTIIQTLHSRPWHTVDGDLRWDRDGSPQGSDILVEWLGGKLVPVCPKKVALHAPVVPKPAWH